MKLLFLMALALAAGSTIPPAGRENMNGLALALTTSVTKAAFADLVRERVDDGRIGQVAPLPKGVK